MRLNGQDLKARYIREVRCFILHQRKLFKIIIRIVENVFKIWSLKRRLLDRFTYLFIE